MKCNYCKTNEARPSSAYCEECAPDRAPEPARSDADSVRSSAWVAEWEAALSHTLRAVKETPAAAMPDEVWERATEAMKVMREIVATNRGHSATNRIT
jgi:hypothetical protein